MNSWKIRLRAGVIHLLISLLIASLAGWLVFAIWYPYPYREISGGRDLFFLVIAVDVVIGPLITLVIFNPEKTFSHLKKDLTVVGFLQLVALIYGLWTVFHARPVYMVFEYNYMTVVHAIDITPAELSSKAPDDLKSFPINGPKLLSLRPIKGAEAVESNIQVLLNDQVKSMQPNLWQSYDLARDEIIRVSQPIKKLKDRFSEQASMIDQAVTETGLPPDRLGTLPVASRKVSWTVLIDQKSANPVGFIAINSF